MLNLPYVKINKLKRGGDVFFSLLIIILTSPLMLVFLLAILIEHILRGQIFAPLFYSETRISQGQPFTLIKFNIFKPEVIADFKKRKIFIHTKNLEHSGHSLIKMGRILQRIYLDELPQLFNVLRGDMSLVGPRPSNLEVYKNLVLEGNFTKKVIRCGLTGNYHCRKNLTKRTQLDLDSEYIRFSANNPAWKIMFLDIWIIILTFRLIFQAKGI